MMTMRITTGSFLRLVTGCSDTSTGRGHIAVLAHPRPTRQGGSAAVQVVTHAAEAGVSSGVAATGLAQ
jgi:alpha/beta superfamily hydrolase